MGILVILRLIYTSWIGNNRGVVINSVNLVDYKFIELHIKHQRESTNIILVAPQNLYFNPIFLSPK